MGNKNQRDQGRAEGRRFLIGLLAAGTMIAAACSNAGSTPPPENNEEEETGGSGGKSGSGNKGGSSGKGTTGGTGNTAGTSNGGTGNTGNTAGTSNGGTGNTGNGGSGNTGNTGGCPPGSFFGLPACASPTKHPCFTCACNDTSPNTLCSAKYAACRDDVNCSKTVECVLSGCPISACEGLVGSSLQKLLDLTPCIQDVCPTECAALVDPTGGGGSGNTGNNGGSGNVGNNGGTGNTGNNGGSGNVGNNGGSGNAAGTSSGCGDTWTITYKITGVFNITDTPLGAGNAAKPVGPGEMVLRFDDVGGAPGGKARLISFSQPMEFSVDSTGLVITTKVVTSADPIECGAARGSLSGNNLTWDTCTYSPNGNDWAPSPTAASGPGCVSNYKSVGNVNCKDGSLFASCSQGNLKDGDNPQNDTWPQPLNTFEFSADLKTFKMRGLGGDGGEKGVQTPNNSPGRTWFNYDGTETSRSKGSGPCCN